MATSCALADPVIQQPPPARLALSALPPVFLHFRGKGGIQQAKEEAQKEAALAAFRTAQPGQQRV
jgi:hypothetical protein